MKRILSVLLCAALLFSGCTAAGPEQTSPSVPKETISPTGVHSDQPTVDHPQTGEYLETALMANVPGQGTPLLLSVRGDGTVDYIFAAEQERGAVQRFDSSGVRYFTIAPDGTATEQDKSWMKQLDAYTEETAAANADPDGRWRFRLAAGEGVVVILAQYHNLKSPVGRDGNAPTEGEILHSAVLKVENGVLSMIPMDWKVELPHQILDLSTVYIDDIALEDGQIVLEKYRDPYIFRYQITARYAMDGAAAEQSWTQMEPVHRHLDADGLVVYADHSPDPRLIPQLIDSAIQTNEYVFSGTLPQRKDYTGQDSLYRLGMGLPNIELEAYGEDGTFYVWFRERENGVLMRYRPEPDGQCDAEEVTVWSLEHIDLIETAVAKWNSTHASPIFRYETASGEEDVTRLNLQLSNGQGPDVLILDGLPVDGYLDFMAPLDALDTSGVYESLLDRFTEQGDLLAVPARMNPYLMGRAAESADVDSLQAFADLVTASTEELDPIGGYRYYKAMYPVSESMQVFQLWYPAWAEEIFGGGRLNEKAYREFMTQTKRLTDHYHLDCLEWYVTDEDVISVIDETDDAMWGNEGRYVFPYTLAATDHVGLYSYWWYEDDYGISEEPIPCAVRGIPGPDGTGAMVPKVIASVRSGGNESAGMAFLQLLLSDELQLGGQYYEPGFADGYPVNWRCTEVLLERTGAFMRQEFAVENDFEQVLSSLRTVVVDEELYRTLAMAAMQYYREEITLDEAVAFVKEHTSLYLAEQHR